MCFLFKYKKTQKKNVSIKKPPQKTHFMALLIGHFRDDRKQDMREGG